MTRTERDVLYGGCLCGDIRYEISATPSDETNCHCTSCRRAHAAPFVAWFTVRIEGFQITQGTPKRFASSAHANRSFCPRCGTPLSFQRNDSPDEIDVSTCSLDEPERVPPRDQTHTRSKVAWMGLDPALPAHLETRP